MKKLIYNVEVGILLDTDNEEFDCYTIQNFYENEFAFYDENRCMFLNLEQAKQYIDEYVENGVKNTYGFVFSGCYNVDEEDLKSIFNEHYCENCIDNPTSKSEVDYFIYKDKENKIKKIINDIYDCEYTYDDMAIVIEITDYFATHKNNKYYCEDVEDILELKKHIKKEWKNNYDTLSFEEQGYVGAYTRHYLEKGEKESEI